MARLSSLLDLDPEIEREIDPEARPLARQALWVEVAEVPAGPFSDPSQPRAEPASLLVIDGMLKREVVVANSRSIEPLGPGDLLRPSQEDAVSFVKGEITVVRPVTLAVIDHDFLGRAGRFPAVADSLLERAMRRSRFKAVVAALHGLVGVGRRISVLFWTLAERWGEIAKGHVFLPLEFRHDELAALVAARRQSVTAALGGLQREGAIERAEGGWILHVRPPEARP